MIGTLNYNWTSQTRWLIYPILSYPKLREGLQQFHPSAVFVILNSWLKRRTCEPTNHRRTCTIMSSPITKEISKLKAVWIFPYNHTWVGLKLLRYHIYRQHLSSWIRKKKSTEHNKNKIQNTFHRWSLSTLVSPSSLWIISEIALLDHKGKRVRKYYFSI